MIAGQAAARNQHTRQACCWVWRHPKQHRQKQRVTRSLGTPCATSPAIRCSNAGRHGNEMNQFEHDTRPSALWVESGAAALQQSVVWGGGLLSCHIRWHGALQGCFDSKQAIPRSSHATTTHVCTCLEAAVGVARAEREQAERRVTYTVPVHALGLQVRRVERGSVWAAHSVRQAAAVSAWLNSPALRTLPSQPRCSAGRSCTGTLPGRMGCALQ